MRCYTLSMSKVICVVLVVAAFVLGVFVGRMPLMSLLLSDGASLQPVQTTTAKDVSASQGGTVVSTTNLSAGQKQLLSALGIDATGITITPAMIACAEAKVGGARVQEISNGATPTLSEGMTLLACYR